MRALGAAALVVLFCKSSGLFHITSGSIAQQVEGRGRAGAREDNSQITAVNNSEGDGDDEYSRRESPFLPKAGMEN